MTGRCYTKWRVGPASKRQPEGQGGSHFGKKSSKAKAVGMEREGHLGDTSKVTMEMYRS